jgi:signal transduction histidine kinase
MISYFKNIVSTEYDQDPSFIRLVRIVLAISALAATLGGVVYAITGSNTPVTWLAVSVVFTISLTAAISLYLTFRNILWPGKVLFPLVFYAAIIFQAVSANGVHDASMTQFTFVIIVATLFAGQRVIPFATFLSILGISIIAYADLKGITKNPYGQVLPVDILGFILIQCLAAAALNGLMTRLNSALKTSQANERAQIKSNQELRQLQVSLEQRVADRTRDLQIASDVSRQITRTLDMDMLLPELVEKTRQGFNLYYVSVYLFNQQAQELSLEAGIGSEGDLIGTDMKSIHIDARQNPVAQAARKRQNIIINDVEQSEEYFRNPHLPDTASEAVFPMLVGKTLVGALDMQSKEKDFFGEDEIQIFVTLAEQIAIAVRNAELYGVQTRAADELRRSDLMKTQFLSSVSHELRTPLNAIINFVEVVALGLVGPVTEEQKELLNNSLNSSTHLLQLINDILDISKIQAGKLALFIEQDVDLYSVLNSVIEIVQPMFAEKPVKLIRDIDNNLPFISGDKRRIRQVLLNLLSNAVKFTDEGTVTLSAKFENTEVIFAVIDTGLGISPEAQSAIFEPFVQTAEGIKMGQGTGLGLPISRSLVQAHGGELWVESQPGEGAAFYFSLPIIGKT